MAKKRYSYIRKKISITGLYCFVLACIALILTLIPTVSAVRTRGEVSMFMSAMGLSSVLIALTGLVFAVRSLRERECNHIFSVIGTVMLLAILIAWTAMLVL